MLGDDLETLGGVLSPVGSTSKDEDEFDDDDDDFDDEELDASTIATRNIELSLVLDMLPPLPIDKSTPAALEAKLKVTRIILLVGWLVMVVVVLVPKADELQRKLFKFNSVYMRRKIRHRLPSLSVLFNPSIFSLDYNPLHLTFAPAARLTRRRWWLCASSPTRSPGRWNNALLL